MPLDNAVPIEFYDIIRKDYEKVIARLQQVEADLKDAIALGDLSENATYDNLSVEKATLRLQKRSAEDFFKTCEILTEAEIQEKYPLLFAIVNVNIIDIDNERESTCTIVPTSNLELGIPNAVRSVDAIGKAILDAGESETRIILKKENIIIEITGIQPYKAGALKIEV